MPGQAQKIEPPDRGRVLRYIVNGVVATAVHFGVLTFNLRVLEIASAGIANLLAATVGIATSFLGSRHFVFDAGDKPIFQQAGKFGLLYALIAVLHGMVLYGWSDLLRLDYRAGFLIATAFQVVLTYWGNKLLVFR
jgi:putative flippase GtrA